MYQDEMGFICVRERGNENFVSVLAPRSQPYIGPNGCSRNPCCNVVQLNINRIEQTAEAVNGDGGDGVAVAVNLSWINNEPLATGCCDPALLPPPQNSIGTGASGFNLEGKDINVRIDEEGNVFLNGSKLDENNPNVSVVKNTNSKNSKTE